MLAMDQRETVRKQSKGRLWRVCRHELYLKGNPAPFAVLAWRYTLERIEIVRVQGKTKR